MGKSLNLFMLIKTLFFPRPHLSLYLKTLGICIQPKSAAQKISNDACDENRKEKKKRTFYYI
jgi:hypothetical protein